MINIIKRRDNMSENTKIEFRSKQAEDIWNEFCKKNEDSDIGSCAIRIATDMHINLKGKVQNSLPIRIVCAMPFIGGFVVDKILGETETEDASGFIWNNAKKVVARTSKYSSPRAKMSTPHLVGMR